MSNEIITKIDQTKIIHMWQNNTPEIITNNVSALIKDNKLILSGLLPEESEVISAQMLFSYPSGYCSTPVSLDIKFKYVPMVLDALSSIELEYSPGDEFKYDIVEQAKITYELKEDVD